MNFDDMVGDEKKFVKWFWLNHTHDYIVGRFASTLLAMGATVPEGFEDGLCCTIGRPLAAFIAANSEFSEDREWVAHCEEICDRYGDASLTPAERNRGVA